MKFIFADCLDVVDPGYDFINDRNADGRKPYWGDQYAHELMGYAPYDGILVSRGIVGDHLFPGKYTTAQAMRFRRDGARKFLRFDKANFKDKMIMGDCGAFSFVELEKPPYKSEDMVDFYGDAQFTHGCSIDHIIFDFFRDNPSEETIRKERDGVLSRYEITLDNASEFIRKSKVLAPDFTPVGVVQGWSPESMGKAAAALEKMGYTYLAVGGLVPLGADSIHLCLKEIRKAVSPAMRIHLLGFAKAEQIHEFVQYNITSFDSTSPLIRSFKDARANYYVPKKDGGMDYYAAIKIPQAIENNKLIRAVKMGKLSQELLIEKEQIALNAMRAYDLNKISFDEVFEAVSDYEKLTLWDDKLSTEKNEKVLAKLAVENERTLRDCPWKNCDCEICRNVSAEVIIFRSNNRNRRRGFHNLAVYYKHLQNTLGK